jgi:small subunit ribosomal protein S8
MTLSDPIADMLTRIRNAIMVKAKEISIPSSNLKVEIAKILKEEGYIHNFKVEDDNKQGILKLTLKYHKGKSAISGLERVSRPGRRVYCGANEIPSVMSGLGVAIISTSKGVLTDKECRELSVGGEVLCYIW